MLHLRGMVCIISGDIRVIGIWIGAVHQRILEKSDYLLKVNRMIRKRLGEMIMQGKEESNFSCGGARGGGQASAHMNQNERQCMLAVE